MAADNYVGLEALQDPDFLPPPAPPPAPQGFWPGVGVLPVALSSAASADGMDPWMPGSLHQRASGPTLPGPPSPLKMLFFYPNQASSGWIYSTVSSLSKYISLQVKLHFPQCPQLGRWSTLSTLLRLPCFTAPSSSPSLGVGGINIMTNTCRWLLCLCVSMSGRGWWGCKSFPQHQKGGTQSSPLGWYHTPVLGAFQFSSVQSLSPVRLFATP